MAEKLSLLRDMSRSELSIDIVEAFEPVLRLASVGTATVEEIRRTGVIGQWNSVGVSTVRFVEYGNSAWS